MSDPSKQLYEFGPFLLEPSWPRLTRDGETVALTPKALEILASLIRHGGQVVEKEVLIKEVWPNTFVEEGNLSVHIFALRKALGETSYGASYIETIPRRGYRFSARVNEIAPDGADMIVSRYTRSEVVIEENETIADKPADSAGKRHLVTGPVASIRQLGVRKTLIATCGVLLAIAGGLFVFLQVRPHSAAPPAVSSVRTIAVLPFRSLKQDPGDEPVAIGMADALITQLSGLRQISIRPTSAITKYANAGQDPQAVGRALGVDAVLAGTIQREGSRVRATVQLINVRDGAVLWATKFDDRQTDIFGMQDLIADQVLRALSISLSPSETERFTKRYTNNPEAYLEYVKGRYFWNKRTVADSEKAIEHFEKAIALDATYALAYSGLADTYAIRAALPPKEAIPKATVAAMKAVELDGELAEAHVSLAVIKELYVWDRKGAEAEYKRAIELNPNYSLAHGFYSMYLASMGRFDEGAAEARRGQEIDPLSPNMHIYAGWNYFNARQYDQSIQEAQKAVDLDTNISMGYNLMVRAYAQKQMYSEAIAAAEKASAISNERSGMLSKEYPYTLASLGYAYALSGRVREARQIIGKLKDLSSRSYVSPNHFAIIYAGLEDKDQALEHLERTLEERDELIRFINVSPIFDGLRSDPRFAALLRRMGWEKT